MLAAIALHGLVRALARPGAARAGRGRHRGSHYTRFLAITAANPLTIASFAAVAAALSADGASALAFVLGVGRRERRWHLVLPSPPATRDAG